MRKQIAIFCLTFSVLFSNIVFGNEFRPTCPQSGCIAANPECPKAGCYNSRFLRDNWINAQICEGSPWVGDLDVNTWDNCVGKITSADESRRIFFGEWKNGQLHGMGYYSSEIPTFEYYGEWKFGRPDGSGHSHWFDGKEFWGFFANGKRHGKGWYTNKDGGKGEEGVWQFGKFLRKDYRADDELCVQALDVNKVNWSSYHYAKIHVTEAKRRRLTVLKCRSLLGLVAPPNRTAKPEPPKVEKPAPTYANLSDPRLCKKALDSSRTSWDRSKKYQSYLNAAQRRGLTIKYCRLVLGLTKPKTPARVANKKPKLVPIGTGSGFSISQAGHILTNEHVIKRCKAVVVHLKQKKFKKAMILAKDKKNDLALLKANFIPKTVFSISQKNAQELDDVIVAGFPLSGTLSSTVKMTKGIVSSLAGVGNDYSRIQIDAAVQPGNSGGPIINSAGRVVAVAVSILRKEYFRKKSGIIPENTNFGVKASVARTFLEANDLVLPESKRKVVGKRAIRNLIKGGTYFLSCWSTKEVKAQLTKARRPAINVDQTTYKLIESILK